MADQSVYQFYAELDDFRPKIWRRFQTRNDITFARLGYIVMTLFEMTGSHLFRIEVPWVKNLLSHRERTDPKGDHSFISSIDARSVWGFEVPFQLELDHNDYDTRTETYDASRSKLKSFLSHEGDKLQFNYDFGDDWNISLYLEKILVLQDFPGKELPRVLEGKGFGIVEDCGGIPGLENLVKAFKKKKGEDYQLYSDWLGIADFDINTFDLDDMNFRVKKLPRIYQQSYEQMLSPTKQSIDLIERRHVVKN